MVEMMSPIKHGGTMGKQEGAIPNAYQRMNHGYDKRNTVDINPMPSAVETVKIAT